MNAFLEVLVVVVLGTAAFYGPIAAGAYLMRKKKLKEAWGDKPALLPPKKRAQLARLLFHDAVQAHQASNHDEAARICSQVLRLESTDMQASRLLMASLFAAGKFDAAHNALERHMAAHPEDKSAKLVPAAIYCEQEDLVRAREALDEINPHDLPTADRALWYNNYAFTLSGLKVDLELAVEYGERALELASPADRQFTLRTIGVVHLARDKPQKALESLQAALKERSHLRPGDIEFTRYHIAEAHVALGETDQALAQLAQIRDGRTDYAEKARTLSASLKAA